MARHLFQKCVFHDLKIKRDLKMCVTIYGWCMRFPILANLNKCRTVLQIQPNLNTCILCTVYSHL